MKILCKQNQYDGDILILPLDLEDRNPYDEYAYGGGYINVDNFLQYSLSVEKTYEVYAIIIYLNKIWYLIFDETLVPTFVPFDLVECLDNTFPWDWGTASYLIKDSLCTIIGYGALLQTYQNITDIVSGKPSSISDLFDYKKRMDEWFS